MKFYCHGQNQPAPVVSGEFENLLCGIFTKIDIFILAYVAEEVLSDKRQREYCLYQKANMVSMPISDTSSIHQCAGGEAFEKGANAKLCEYPLGQRSDQGNHVIEWETTAEGF